MSSFSKFFTLFRLYIYIQFFKLKQYLLLLPVFTWERDERFLIKDLEILIKSLEFFFKH